MLSLLMPSLSLSSASEGPQRASASLYLDSPRVRMPLAGPSRGHRRGNEDRGEGAAIRRRDGVRRTPSSLCTAHPTEQGSRLPRLARAPDATLQCTLECQSLAQALSLQRCSPGVLCNVGVSPPDAHPLRGPGPGNLPSWAANPTS